MTTTDIRIARNAITDVATGVVALRSAPLRDELLHNQAPTLAALSAGVSPVTLAEISIDDHGRVVVANPAFSQVVLDRLQHHSAANALEVTVNIVCITIKF